MSESVVVKRSSSTVDVGGDVGPGSVVSLPRADTFLTVPEWPEGGVFGDAVVKGDCIHFSWAGWDSSEPRKTPQHIHAQTT